MDSGYYTELLDPLYAGRRWIVVADAASGAAREVARILEAEAAAVMVVAARMGPGPPAPDEAEVFVVGTAGSTFLDEIRAYAAAVTTPSPELCSAVDSFDPSGQATVLTSHAIPAGELCRRPVHGATRAEWKSLEDKLIVDRLWDDAGIERAPSLLVPSTPEQPLRDAVAAMESAEGAVIVADNAEGWHGGAEYTRHLAPGRDSTGTLGFFAEHSRRVRVMPFLTGVPCSIHGLVMDDAVLAFRPVEVLTFRRADSDEFMYTGTATVWDPPPGVRSRMRDAVRSVGEVLRERVGYRGAFGIDGVCTKQGFLPTELNPRLTVGLGIQCAPGGYPIADIHRAVVAGLDIDLRPRDLEQGIVESADTNRSGRWVSKVNDLAVDSTIEQPVAYGGSWRAAEASHAAAVMSLGPSPPGALLRVELTADHGLSVGGSIAGAVAASFRFADELWDTGIGELVPCRPPPR